MKIEYITSETANGEKGIKKPGSYCRRHKRAGGRSKQGKNIQYK